MKIIDTILQSEIFTLQPPILIDIGASGEINNKWKPIAKYSTCIAFDADDREFNVKENKNSGYKKLLLINRIVSDVQKDVTDFYLTKFAFCSSTLEPDLEKLKPWAFHSLFQFDKKVQLPAISLERALQQSDIHHIDWFKADTQGTDLRLFKSIPSAVKQNILAAEFEPGIIDAYKGEDKLFTLMQEMHMSEFWLSSMDVKGVQRINTAHIKADSFTGKRLIKKSPGWAELVYLRNTGMENKRQLLLLYIFALLERQYGFAIEVADKGLSEWNDPLFSECKKAVLKKLRTERLKIPLVIFKKQVNKLLTHIND